MTNQHGEPLRLKEDPHRRLNALTNEWVLVSPHRATRPWLGEIGARPATAVPEYDPECYLCPGNARAGGARNPAYSSTFVFDNDFAALKPDVTPARLDIDGKGLIVAESEPGLCRVMCFSPRHDLTLGAMQVHDVELVIKGWVDEFRLLGARENIRHVQIFENRGTMMGASNPHPHCQVWATASIPEAPAKELAAQGEYLRLRNRCMLCDYLELENRQKIRLVYQNQDFSALVPFWAVWPFEILVCSRRHFGSMLEFNDGDISSLADMLKRIASTYDKVFDVPFPYSMGFHQSPTDDREHPEWHFHAHFYPPLLRSATVRKFMVGFEMLGTPQRDITPEIAAERLQSLIRENSNP
jgi:UDPglucose--hexose-1-phosphate uridylyltransferase